jgi:hypothetical protein
MIQITRALLLPALVNGDVAAGAGGVAVGGDVQGGIYIGGSEKKE